MKTSAALLVHDAGFENVYEYCQHHKIQFGKGRSHLTATFVCLTGMGLLYQSVATALDRLRYPPPGTMIDVDGCRLHMQSAGSGAPTVVLESGLGGMSSAWAWIQPETAKFTHVVSYDRAGLGWSGLDNTAKTAVQVATRLRTLLRRANTVPPYLLVGHSMGGLFIRVFADLFPQEVAGLVLVDAAHPDQHHHSSAIATHMRSGFRMLKGAPVLAGLGYIRLSGFFDSWAEGLPEKEAGEAGAFLSSYRHLKTTRDESRAWDTVCAEVRATGGLGDKPLAVVTAGKAVLPGQPELQAELASLSSNSVHLAVREADHVTLVTNRHNACFVVEAIHHVVRTWRASH